MRLRSRFRQRGDFVPSGLIRWGGVAAMLAGIVFLVDEILNLMNPAPYLDIMFIVAMLLVVAGLVGFHTLQIGSYGRIGQAAFYTVIVSSLSQLLGLVLLLSG